MASSIDDNVADGNSGKSLCEMWMIQYTIVLTAAAAASLLILWRSPHEKNCAKFHASMKFMALCPRKRRKDLFVLPEQEFPQDQKPLLIIKTKIKLFF